MNKLTRIEELARKLNQEILALEVVQEYQKYYKKRLSIKKQNRMIELQKQFKNIKKKKHIMKIIH